MFADLFESTDFVQTVELWPPGYRIDGPPSDLESQFSWLSERLEILGEYFDGMHIADLKKPGRAYMDSLITAIRLKDRFKWIEVAPTMSARDRNRKALQEAVASALHSGIDNLILVRGDPYLEGEKGHSKNVYDITKVSDLVSMARDVQARTSSGNLTILTPIDLARVDDEGYLEMAVERERAGSGIFLTQIYTGELDDYLLLIDKLRSAGVRSPILHDVFPFFGYEDALDIARRFGITVHKPVLEELKEGGLSAGIRIASRFRESLRQNRGKVNGVFVSSRGEPELAIRLVK